MTRLCYSFAVFALVALFSTGCSSSKATTSTAAEGTVTMSQEAPHDASSNHHAAMAEPAAEEDAIVGDWEGQVNVPNGGPTLRVIFHITKDENGKLTATGESPDQGPGTIPGDQARYKEGRLFIAFDQIGASFSGTLEEGILTGAIEQGGLEMPIQMKRTTK